jgi:hypothetical protein
MFPLTAFRVLPRSKLSEEEFDAFPVWCEHYDWEEIEDIERWGLNRDETLRLFNQNSQGNEHCVYTLLEANPFPQRIRIFIRAIITGADGRKLKGYVMNEGAFCLTIFHDNKQFVFSRHPMLNTENKRHEEALCNAIGGAAVTFPALYETEFKDT